jgi:hypothetical protein
MRLGTARLKPCPFKTGLAHGLLAVARAIDRFVRSYQETAPPFEWTKTEVHPAKPKPRYSDLRK